MKKNLLVVLLFFYAISNADGIAGNEIAEFKENAEVCNHLSGEWGSELPEENKREIKINMNSSCGKAKVLYWKLKKKYNGNKRVSIVLKKYEDVKNFQRWD
ncbi:hypothetical protein [Vogesella sp. LIG4]|uniref:hypothetical protein n=1 Tax=Vogesella sp. LIG4 TaxID=1192162 RepID=UPI0012FDE48A|nr:hypothetical protein [Vogesella sp. LIG4]